MISYEPLWETMKRKGITKYALSTKYGISNALLYRLRHNESVTLYTIQNLCNILKCGIADIVVITIDEESEINKSNLSG